MFRKLLQPYYAWAYRRMVARRRFSDKTVSEIFTETFQKRYWRSKESVSGQGAELNQTTRLRTALPVLLQQFGVQTLLDLPCGDFNWMQKVELPGIRYIGGDIVEALVLQNQSKFGNQHRSFRHLDLLTDQLPEADCILVRDCLVHFSLDHIREALDNICRSRIRYLLCTSFPETAYNEEIQTGFWRPLNLQKAPFHFPEPLFCMNEGCTEAGGAFSDKSLCLWEIAKIK